MFHKYTSCENVCQVHPDFRILSKKNKNPKIHLYQHPKNPRQNPPLKIDDHHPIFMVEFEGNYIH